MCDRRSFAAVIVSYSGRDAKTISDFSGYRRNIGKQRWPPRGNNLPSGRVPKKSQSPRKFLADATRAISVPVSVSTPSRPAAVFPRVKNSRERRRSVSRKQVHNFHGNLSDLAYVLAMREGKFQRGLISFDPHYPAADIVFFADPFHFMQPSETS